MNTNEAPQTRRRKIKITHILILLSAFLIGSLIVYKYNLKSNLDKKIDAIRDAGYPVSLFELDDWYSIPNDEENAAYLILEAYEYYQEPEDSEQLPVVGQADLPAQREPIPEETMKQISSYLEDNKQCLDLLHEAGKLEHSRYPCDLSLGFNTIAPHIQHIRDCVKLLELEALMHAENDNPKMAVQSVKTIFSVADSLSNEPLLVSQLVRISCYAVGISALEYVLNRITLTDEQLAELSIIVGERLKQKDILAGLAGERCVILSILHFGNSGPNPGFVPFPLLKIINITGLVHKDAIICLDAFEEYMQIFQLPPHERRSAVNKISDNINNMSKIHFLVQTLMPVLDNIITIDLRSFAYLLTVQVAMATERYRLATGAVPDSLNELVPEYLSSIPMDPFDGKELRYKKLDPGFVIYSVGEDLSDDNGTEMPENSRERNSSNWDVTFTIER